MHVRKQPRLLFLIPYTICLVISTLFVQTISAHAITTHDAAAAAPIVIHTPLFVVNNVLWSPDSQRLAVANGDGILQTWTAANGRLIATHADSSRSLYSTALGWTQHGQNVVSYGLTGSYSVAQRWDATTGQSLLTMPQEAQGLIRLSPDGKRIAFAHDTYIDIRDTSTGQLIRTINTNSSIFSDIAWSPDSTRLATTNTVFSGSNETNTAQVWSVVTGKRLAVHPSPSNQNVARVTWFPDGKKILSATEGAASRIVENWSATTGKTLFTYPTHPQIISSLSLAPDGKHIALGIDYDIVQEWDAANGHVIFSEGSVQKPWTASAWSPNGQQLVAVGYNVQMQIRDAATGHIVRTYHNADGMDHVVWSPDGKLIATIGNGVKVWRATADTRVASIDAHHQSERAVTWSSDGTQIAAEDGSTLDVGFWNAKTGEALGDLVIYHENLGRYSYTNKSTVAWSPNGAHVAESSGNSVLVWGNQPVLCDSSACVEDAGDHSAAVTTVAWSPDSNFVASASRDKTVIVYDIAKQVNRTVYSGHTSTVNAIAWSPSGSLTASGDDNGHIRLWNPANGATSADLSAPQRHGITALSWSPDGTRLAAASRDGFVDVWDITHRSILFTYRGHTGAVNGVAWSPDGTRIASAGSDKTVRIWSATTGNTLFTYTRHTDSVWSVAWSHDSTRLASASADGTLQIWQA